MSDELKAVLICVIVLPLTLLLKKFFESSGERGSDDQPGNNGEDDKV